MRQKRSSRLNKTKKLEIPLTEEQHKAVLDCAHKLGFKHTEWARSKILNAVQVECLRPAPQEQEQKGE